MADVRRLRVKRRSGRLRVGTPLTITVELDGTVSVIYDERATAVRFDHLSELLTLHGLAEADLEELGAR